MKYGRAHILKQSVLGVMAKALVCCLLTVCCGNESSAQRRPAIVESLELAVLQAPGIANVGGARHLVYELHLTNLRASDVVLTRVEILNADRPSTEVVGEFRDSTLQSALGRSGVDDDDTDSRILHGGMRAVLYVWLPIDQKPPLSALTHRVEFDIVRANAREHVVSGGPRVSIRSVAPLVLGAPLRGGRWVGVYDPSVERGHRRVIYTVNGRARIPARFAIDWMKLGNDNKFTRDERSKIANWWGYGAEVLAVADATVVDAKDDIAEKPSIVDPPVRVALEDASGNHIALDLGNGAYAFYEHLKQGSIRVKVGDRVKRGQVIAALGNTGSSSSGPHLHFHVSDANESLGAEGLPYVLDQFTWLGAFEKISDVGRGASPTPLSKTLDANRRSELPPPNSVVSFD